MPSSELSTANASSYLTFYVLQPRKNGILGRKVLTSYLVSNGLRKGL